MFTQEKCAGDKTIFSLAVIMSRLRYQANVVHLAIDGSLEER